MHRSSPAITSLWLMTGLLAVIFLTRLLTLPQRQFTFDEVWNAWQTAGTLGQVFTWLPYDWPPLYFTLIWAWQQLTGADPLTLRLSSVLIFMVGCAATYRFGWRWWGTRAAGIGTAAVMAALGYYVFLSGYFRGYGLMLALLPLAMLALLGYFDRPTLARAALLALAMAALFYTNLTAVVVFGLMGVVSLVWYGARVWRWWLPGLLAFALALPEVLAKLDVVTRRHAGQGDALPPLVEGYAAVLAGFAGQGALIWLGAGLGALLLLLRCGVDRRLLALAAWLLALPVIVYALDRVLGFFTTQYSWWLGMGIALLLGGAFALLPRPARGGALAVLCGVMLISFDFSAYRQTLLPMEATLRDVAPLVQRGDVFVMDPGCACGSPMEWTYYQQRYFPQGIAWASDPTGHARVWYVSREGSQDAALRRQIERGRIPSRFVGPWNLLIRLYEGPPDAVGVRLANGMRFHGIQALDVTGRSLEPLVRREDEALRVRLWWSTDAPLTADLSITLQAATSAGILAQSDGAPQLIQLDVNGGLLPAQTSQWQVNRLYVEERELVVPIGTPQSDWTLYVGVYQWWDGVRIVPDAPHQGGLLSVGRLNVMSW